jgi:hypothetical protein
VVVCLVADFSDSLNRTVYASTVCLGHSATLHSHGKPPPHFAGPGLATQALIRAAKTSYTAGTIYEEITAGKKARLYGKKGFSIPRPEFIVLYNGVEPYPEEKTIRLSDSFEDVSSLGLPVGALPDLELSARVYNINEGHNVERVERSEALRGYVRFIGKVREYEGELIRGRRPGEIPREERRKVMKTAITKGVQWCISRDILKGFLERNGSEVMNMLFDEWKLEDALVVEREEGREEGKEEGREEVAKNALREGVSLELVQKITGLPSEIIQNLADRETPQYADRV